VTCRRGQEYKKDRTQKVTENALPPQTFFPSSPINQILHVGSHLGCLSWLQVSLRSVEKCGSCGGRISAFPLTWHIAYTTASCYRTSCEKDKKRIISYGGKGPRSAERNYMATEKELSACVVGMQYYHEYLQPKPFLIRTDNLALKYLNLIKKTFRVAWDVGICCCLPISIVSSVLKAKKRCDGQNKQD